MDKGENPRFVVTNLSSEEYEAQELYEKLYCARGEMENRIKEQQLHLFADRTSSATMRANQIRLWFSSLAYVIMNELRSCRTSGNANGRSHVPDHEAEAIEDRGAGSRERPAGINQHGQWLSRPDPIWNNS